MTVYGNAAAKAALDAAQRGRVSHAYLFYGEKGTGKRTMVSQLTSLLLCIGKTPPCGSCNACVKLAAGAHPDVTVLDGAAATIKVGEVRRCKMDAQVRPNESDYRIFQIFEADNMTSEAANALLKLLEEPPPHAVFLLTAQNRDACPSTVVSRCLPVPCTSPTVEECMKALSEQCEGVSAEQIKAAANEAYGNVGVAMELLSSAENEAEERFRGVCAALEQQQELPLLLAFAPYEKDTNGLMQLSGRMADYCAQAAVDKAQKKRTGVLERYTLAQLLQMEQLFRQAQRRLSGKANAALTAAWLPAMLRQIQIGESWRMV